MELQQGRVLSFKDMLYVIFKQKKKIIFFFFGMIFIVLVVTYMITPTYQAEARILIKMGRENIYIPPNSDESKIIKPNSEDQINSEIELLKSRSLAETVLTHLRVETIYPGLDLDTGIKKFQAAFSASGIEKSNIISLRFMHEDRRLAAAIVNTIVDVYLEKHLVIHKNLEAYNFFEDQSKLLKSRLSQAEENLRNFKKLQNVTNIDEEQKLFLTQISDLRGELNRSESQKAEIENKIFEINRQLESTPKTMKQGEVIDYNTALIGNLEAKLIELKLKEKELLIKYTPQSRLVKNVEDEIQMVQEKLSEQETKQHGKSNIGINATYQRLKEELFRNQAEQKAVIGRIEVQQLQLSDLKDKLEKLNQIEVEVGQLKQLVDVNHKNYQFYLAKFEESRISDAMDNKKIANISLIEPAYPPLKPIKPNIFLNLLIGIFLGTFGGMGLAFLAESLDPSIEKPEDVEKLLNLPVLASIPET